MKNKRLRIEMKLSLTDILDDSRTTHTVLAPEPSHELSQVMELNLNCSATYFQLERAIEAAISVFTGEVESTRVGIVRDLLEHRKR